MLRDLSVLSESMAFEDRKGLSEVRESKDRSAPKAIMAAKGLSAHKESKGSSGIRDLPAQKALSEQSEIREVSGLLVWKDRSENAASMAILGSLARTGLTVHKGRRDLQGSLAAKDPMEPSGLKEFEVLRGL